MKTIDRNIIEKYLQGKLTHQELKSFEEALTKDEFLRDAVEGYEKTKTSPNNLNKIDTKFLRKPKKNKNIIFGIIYSGVAAAIIIVFVFILKIDNNKPNQKPYAENNNQTNTINPEPENHIVASYNINIDTTNIIIHTNTALPTLTTELRHIEQTPTPAIENITPLYINKNLIIENNIPQKDLNKYYRFKSNHNYSYMDNFKIVDYRFAGRNNNFEIITSEPLNTKTSIAHNPNNINENHKITYIELLENALENLSAKKYPEAIDNFNIILNQYPDDQNAIFYKGICYYETNKNSISLRYFDAALNSKINTFHEDAKWYKSIIYKKEKQYEIAHKILEEIINDNGYYGVQAKRELDELYKEYINE
jgi:TolA-binding protein